MKRRPPLRRLSSLTRAIVFLITIVAAAQILSAQTSGESDESDRELITDTTLEEKSVFDLMDETRRMALRGTREASIKATIAGKNLPLKSDNPVVSYPGQITDGTGFLDPYGGSFAFVAFRQSYDFPFDFGNGVRKILRIVPVRSYNGNPDAPTGSYRDNVLLDLAYSGEVEIEGVGYIVEVVQGASPEFKDRLSYPGYFDSADVSVLLYHADTGERLPDIGRLKRINGKWYEFLSNPSGEKLVVNRLKSTGLVRINTGGFPQVDFGFTSGSFQSPNGWSLSLKGLDFSDGVEEIPAGDYTFTEFVVRNNGQSITYVWHPDFGPDRAHFGSLAVPAGGEVDFKIGRSAEIDFRFDPRYTPEVFSFYNPEWLKFRIFDADLGGAVVATDSQPYVSSYTNSEGNPITPKWQLKPCGWDGMWWIISQSREYENGNFILGQDSQPPAVEDIRSVTMSCQLRGLFGSLSATMDFKARNEVKRLHGRFYDFDEPLEDFPDFTKIAPKLELANASMGSGSETPWQGLPADMADTFGAVYEFYFSPKDLETCNFELIVGAGVARLYVNDEFIMEGKNFEDTVQRFASGSINIKGSGYPRVRVEYFHNSGKAYLSLSAKEKKSFYYYDFQLNPDPGIGSKFIGLNPAYIPAKFDVRTTWKGGTTFVLGGQASSPDGIERIDYFLDGALVATTQGPDIIASLPDVALDSEVVLRAVDVNGFGTLYSVGVEGESLEEWMERYGLSDPEADEDGDGVSNRQEYIAGTVPLPPPPFSVRHVNLDGNRIILRWDGDKAGSKLVGSYQVEVSKDLKSWTPHGARISLREDGIYNQEIPAGNLGSKVFFRVVPDLL